MDFGRRLYRYYPTGLNEKVDQHGFSRYAKRRLYLVSRLARLRRTAQAATHSDPHPDLILLNVMMPEWDGGTVLSRLRENPTPAVVFTRVRSQREVNIPRQ
ncbi:response regulator [Methylomonas sp. LW13]|nr:response regulator [Methylomonas sp. LW13]